MDTLFIPGWLITSLIAAVIILILLVKGYVNAKPNEVVVIQVFGSNATYAGKLVYDSLCRTTLLS